MGDRACVLFFDGTAVSPTVYLHWHGRAVPARLAELKTLMHGRNHDAAYAAARFVGICHAHIGGNLSLGVTSNRLVPADLRNPAALAALSPGNAGLVLVDTTDFTWRAVGGYLADAHHQPVQHEE
ncbi:MAG: hypothetical protein K2V38_24610 [Gemmataceae bacterium]|nr:hypothetical protein [Gemmataceae bacterium]